MEELYNQIDFIVSGGALKLLTDFLGSKELPALVLEPKGDDFQVLDAVGVIPDALMIQDRDLHVRSLFPTRPPLAAFEVEQAHGNEKWPRVVRMRGAHWELYLLLAHDPGESIVSELHPYAGLIRLWRAFQRIDDTEKQLARLSYMILATKNTLASIFEPMPLQYFATFLSDVLRESLFPKSIAILKDEGDSLAVLNGTPEKVPERLGIYAEPILPSTPVVTRETEPVEVVLPVTDADCRLFCLMTWDKLPDTQMMNFLELLGNLAARAVTISSLRAQSQEAAASSSSGEFTVLSLSNVLKILHGAETRQDFLDLLTDIFLEQCRMPDCVLALWDGDRQGYTLVEKRVGQIKTDADTSALLPSSGPVPAGRVQDIFFDLGSFSPDDILRSWGLDGCPWQDVAASRCLFPICDDDALLGMIAVGPRDQAPIDKAQQASLHLIAQFAAYALRRW